MRLPDNYFRSLSPADIIAKVATITLANISLLGPDELERIGWLNNPIIDILYSMTSAGVWISRVNTSGLITDANSAAIAVDSEKAALNTVPPSISGYILTDVAQYKKRIPMKARIPYTLAGGVQANLQLVPGLANYFAVIDSILVKPVNAIAAFQMTFECPAGTAIETCELVLVAQTMNDQLRDYVVHGVLAADASDGDPIVVDLAGGAGAETGTIIVTYHYET